MRKELAEKVYQHLRKDPNSLWVPPKKDESHLRLFEIPHMLTDEEGEFMLHFNFYFETAESIAKRTGLNKSNVLELLDSLTKKFWLMRIGTKDEGKYRINNPLEYYMPILTPENVGELMAIYTPDPPEPGSPLLAPVIKKFGTGKDEALPELRVVPRERALPFDKKILASETVSYLIENSPTLAVAECLCRKVKKVAGGEPCRRLDSENLEQCLFLEPFAESAIEIGVARRITKNEAYDLMERAKRCGLIHVTYSNAHPRIICSCCSCCCLAYPAMEAIDGWDKRGTSNYYSQIDPKLCKGSKECIIRCPENVIQWDEVKKVAVVNSKKCIGCGICVETCPHHAASLNRRENTVVVPVTEDDFTYIRATQGKGSMEVVKDYPGAKEA